MPPTCHSAIRAQGSASNRRRSLLTRATNPSSRLALALRSTVHSPGTTASIQLCVIPQSPLPAIKGRPRRISGSAALNSQPTLLPSAEPSRSGKAAWCSETPLVWLSTASTMEASWIRGPRRVTRAPPVSTKAAATYLHLVQSEDLVQPLLQARSTRVLVVSRTAPTQKATATISSHKPPPLSPPLQRRERPTSKLPVCELSTLARGSRLIQEGTVRAQ